MTKQPKRGQFAVRNSLAPTPQDRSPEISSTSHSRKSTDLVAIGKLRRGCGRRESSEFKFQPFDILSFRTFKINSLSSLDKLYSDSPFPPPSPLPSGLRSLHTGSKLLQSQSKSAFSLAIIQLSTYTSPKKSLLPGNVSSLYSRAYSSSNLSSSGVNNCASQTRTTSLTDIDTLPHPPIDSTVEPTPSLLARSLSPDRRARPLHVIHL